MNIDWKTYLVNFVLHYVMIGVGVFVAHFGWLNMDANNVSLALTQYIVAGLIAGIPLVLQHWKLSNVLAQVKQFLTASANTGQVPTVAVTGTISPLTGVAKAAMILICVGMVGFASGCASDTATAYATRMTFNQGVNDLTTLHTSPGNPFSDQDYHTINTTEHAISPLLDQLDTAAAKADANKVNIFAEFDYESIFSQVMSQLTPLLEKRSTVTNPTTQPSK